MKQSHKSQDTWVDTDTVPLTRTGPVTDSMNTPFHLLSSIVVPKILNALVLCDK